MILREAFDYRFSRLDPTGAHIDPPSVALYETLVAKGPNGRAHPLLAQSWEASPDGLEWVVRLRPGLRFHSGAPCDAAAVVQPLEYLRRESVEGRQLWYWDPVDTVEALDATTIRFRLHYPYARLPALLWGTHTAVFDEVLRAREPERFGYEVASGTGPYRLASHSPERVVAERWPEYRSPATGFLAHEPAVERIEWVALLDAGERLAALEAGDVDVLHGPPYEEVERLRDESRLELHEQPQASNMYLALDFRRRDLGFDDVRVRRALSLGLDRGALVAGALAGHGSPSFGGMPPGDEHYDGAVDAAGRHDPGAADELLAEAGFVRGEDGVLERGGVRLACECIIQEDPVFARVAALAAAQLAELGVQLELRPVEPFAPFYEAVASGPPAAISKWLWQDALDALIGFTTTSTAPFPNWQHASVPALDAAYRDWLHAEDDPALRAAASRVQHLVAATLPYVPLLVPDDVWAWSPRVRGYRPFPANLYPFYQPVVVER